MVSFEASDEFSGAEIVKGKAAVCVRANGRFAFLSQFVPIALQPLDYFPAQKQY
jgi:hypothetical protein